MSYDDDPMDDPNYRDALAEAEKRAEHFERLYGDVSKTVDQQRRAGAVDEDTTANLNAELAEIKDHIDVGGGRMEPNANFYREMDKVLRKYGGSLTQGITGRPV